jgi:hypothetical protein
MTDHTLDQRHRLGPGVICLAWGLFILSSVFAAKPIGKAHAYIHQFLGYDAVMSYGLCIGPCREYEQILLERYGVRSFHVAGCMPLGPEAWYADGYNEVARTAIVNTHGRDIFNDSLQEAFGPYHSAMGATE